MNTVDAFVGAFEGAGAWHDAAGKSMAYRIRQTNAATADGFAIEFTHDFDDGSIVTARFSMIWIAPNLFRVDIAGAPVGNGYIFDAYCHYHLKMGEKFVEASYQSTPEGLEVFGSSTTNAEGLYIAWTETLRRAAS